MKRGNKSYSAHIADYVNKLVLHFSAAYVFTVNVVAYHVIDTPHARTAGVISQSAWSSITVFHQDLSSVVFPLSLVKILYWKRN